MTDFIKRKRKKKARQMREGKVPQENSNKTLSNHRMEWGKDKSESKKRGRKYTPLILLLPLQVKGVSTNLRHTSKR